jgi:hypothetical protein
MIFWGSVDPTLRNAKNCTNSKFKICQSSIDIKKSEFLIKASLTDFKFRIRWETQGKGLYQIAD